MSLKVAVFGAQGRMGQELVKLVTEAPQEWNLVAEVDRKDSASSVLQARLVIDFSAPPALQKLLAVLNKNPRPLVSGTTGLKPAGLKKLQAYSKKAPVLWAPNMSLGVAVLKRSLTQLALLSDYDFQIEELHHRWKKDAPSGTAKFLQEALQMQTQKKLPQPLSMRGGGAAGLHRVWALGPEEWICFEHMALDRRVFARGALTVGKWLQRQRAGFYSLESYLDGVAKK